MSKRFWLVIGVIAAVFAGIMLLNNNNSNGGNAAASKTTNHVKGNTKSQVKLVEYGDFQCPFCGQYYPIVEQVADKYKDQISFQFVHYPLTQIHLNAVAASRAAEAASNQGKFWEMYGMLYQNQQVWSNSDSARSIFEGYASQLGLDVSKFKKDFASSETNARINADKSAFNKTGMKASTPTFTLNGKQIKPVATVEDFSKIIDAELKKHGINPPTTETEQPAPETPQQ